MGGGDGIGDTDGVLPLVHLLQAGFLSALGALADAAPAGGDGVAIQTLQFQGGALEIKLRTADADRLERLSQRLRAAGWRTEITGGGAVSGGYEGRIRLVRG